MSAWLAWSAAAWHWVLYPLAAAAITAVIGGWLYYREPPGEAARYERELDREFGPLRYLPGPELGPVTVASARPDSRTVRVGEHHLEQPRYPELDPQLRPDWLENQLAKGRGWLYYQIYVKQPRDRARDLAEIAAWAA